MPTPTPTDPFTPQGSVPRETLERYVRGELGDAERHMVELHLESDPLLREALEGLRMPGALEAMRSMPRPQSPGMVTWSRLLIAGLVIAGGWIAAVLWTGKEPAHIPQPTQMATLDLPFRADSVIAVVKEELAEATPPPAPQQIGHEPAIERPPLPRDTGVTRIQRIELVDTNPVSVSTPVESGAPKEVPATHAPRSSRQLAFLHELKLVDPKELYERSPLLMEPGGVPAGFADEEQMRDRTEAPRTMRYLDFMDAALGKFVRNDHRGCLEELLFMLGQYPKDINARFYAGLCCYNLGLADRAADYMRAVAADPIDTFREEADWYLALSTERASGIEAARPLFKRVADEGGFYAGQARAKLRP